MANAVQSRAWRPSWPVNVAAQLGPLRKGTGDPTHRVVDGAHWRGLRTPVGPATLRVQQRGDDVLADAWGSGAEWALEHMPRMLGDDDDPTGLDPRGHELIVESLRRHGPPRVGATDLVLEVLVPTIIEQKVTGQEAFAGIRRMVHRYGERAPGPGADQRLWIKPDATTLRSIPSWEWLKFPVSPVRSRAVVSVARVASSLERTVGLDPAEVDRLLTSLPGIGEWTSAEVRRVAHGDADAVSFGDYHVAKDMGWALTGSPWTDDQLREFLEPFRPHRGRVVSLVYALGGKRPRRGPRMSPRTHLPGHGGFEARR